MSSFHTLSVKSIIRQTPKAVQIIFNIPEELKDQFQYEAGQYVTLSAHIDGEEVRRSYSICSAQNEDLSVAVKAIEDGVFSNYVNTTLKENDTLEVMPPEGHFVVDNLAATSHYCAFAAGSGITPVMSMLKSILSSNDTSKFVLVYGNKTPEETIFYKEINDLQAQYPDRFFVEYIFSQSREDNARFGRIEKPIINFTTKNKYSDIDFTEYFLCGPEEMINHTKEVLLENGVDANRIKFELFYSSAEANENITSDGTTHLSVIVDDETHELVMQKDELVLDAILKQDIDVPYSCQGGVCSSCIAIVKEGKALMQKNQILTDSEVAEGLILTCQAVPQSSKLVVDYDDV
jgi:ring-1,2-phenylacetyl-CoA epoxidase subunit PaaE